MGLREEVQTDVAEAMNGDLADAVATITYTAPSTGAYDPNTGEVTQDETSYPGRAILYDAIYADVPANPSLKEVTKKGVILQNELDATPAPDGVIRTPTETLLVLFVKPDPAEATWELYMKAHPTG